MHKFLWLAAGCCLVLLGCSAESPEPVSDPVDATPAKMPNFILFTTDDMGYTDIGAFGGIHIPTPNLDRLAMEGVRLTNFHVASSCAHTRSMLMSGNGNNEAGMGAQRSYPEYIGMRGYEQHISERVATIPERLVEAGYHTYMAGKWHLGDEQGETLPGDRGFERSFALLGGGNDHFDSEKQTPYGEDGQIIYDLPEDFYSTTAYVDKMISYIESNQGDGQPFFGWFAPTAPHWPLQAHPDWKDRFVGTYDAGYEALCWQRLDSARRAGILPDGVDMTQCPKDATPWKDLTADEQAIEIRVMELYAAMVAHVDFEFGRLLDYLEESGELDNTYIIYHNDNGPQGGGIFDSRGDDYNNTLENLGNRDSWATYGQGWADALSVPYRGNKGSQFEGGIRTAAFIYTPDSASSSSEEQGRKSNSLLTVMDVLPTILDIAGIEDSYITHETVLPIRGKSFAALIDEQDKKIHADDEYIPLDFQGVSSLTKGEWKIVRPTFDEHFQLFQIFDDPSETTDLREQEPAIYEDLLTAYEAHADDVGIVRRTSGGGPDD